MAKTVLGVFTSRHQAEKAVNDLRQEGFDREISIVAKDEGGRTSDITNDAEGMKEGGDRNTRMFGGDGVADGATTGGVVGGIAGLALGAGALAIPGIGPIIAAGPVAGLLSGAATGGIAGGLLDWGIPEERGRYYEEKVKEGNFVAIVHTSEDKIDKAAEILKKNGANNVESH